MILLVALLRTCSRTSLKPPPLVCLLLYLNLGQSQLWIGDLAKDSQKIYSATRLCLQSGCFTGPSLRFFLYGEVYTASHHTGSHPISHIPAILRIRKMSQLWNCFPVPKFHKIYCSKLNVRLNEIKYYKNVGPFSS